MPITDSAKKAVRQAARRKAINDRRRKNMRTAVKAVKEEGKPESLAVAYQAIDKAVKRGVIHKNAGARKKSLMARTITRGVVVKKKK
jgi:small subunit ribosomal protein S20